jgi:hypothetical protein
MKSGIEYYIKEHKNDVMTTGYKLRPGQRLFAIAKFEGSDTTDTIYYVVYTEKDNIMQCDCPNKRRGAHINDKHGQMVAKWLIAGCPRGHFDSKGDFHHAASLQDAGDFEADQTHEE